MYLQKYVRPRVELHVFCHSITKIKYIMDVFKLGRISNPGVQLKLMNLGLTQNQLVHGMSVMKIAQRLLKHLNGMRYEAYFPS